jgi:hypothetical protein
VTAAACRDVALGHPKGTGIGAPRPPFNATLALHVGDISYSGPNSGGNTTLVRFHPFGWPFADLLLCSLDKILGLRQGAMLWDVFLAEQECLSSAMPYMVAAGNHDVCPAGIDIDGYTSWCGGDSGWECGSEYLARYKMPGANYTAPADGYNSTRDCLATYHSTAAKYWHSYTYGPIRFIVVSTEHDFSPGSPQLLWLANELAAIDRQATPWVIVYGHRPTYCSGIYLNQCGEEGASHYMAATLRRRMEPLFVKAKVDLVLWGHEHAYERIHPAINGTVVGRTTDNPAAPINLVLGMGGAGNSYMSGWREPPPEWVAHREMSFGHGRITLLSASELHFEYVAVDGVVHDEFFLTKGGRRRPKTDEHFAAGIERAALPVRGWRSWHWVAWDINQEIGEAPAAAMAVPPPWAKKSLLDLGYNKIGLDDCWQSCTGPKKSFHDPEANGAPIVNKTKFPDLASMAAKAKALGLSPGFYGDNCRCHAGEKQAGVTHYVQDVALTLASGFEGTKIDSCGNQRDMSQWAAQFALRNQSMLVESCGNGPAGSNPKEDLPPLPSYLEMLATTCPWSFYRVSVDLAPQFLSCVYNLNRALPFLDTEAPLSRPGCWAYPDMRPSSPPVAAHLHLCFKLYPSSHSRSVFAVMVGVDVPRPSGQPHYDNTTMSWVEWRSHFAMWAITSSPLILGFDLTNRSKLEEVWPIIANEEILAISQSWHGHPGRLVGNSSEYRVMRTAHGSPDTRGSTERFPSWQAWAKQVSNDAVALLVVRVWVGAANATLNFNLQDLQAYSGYKGDVCVRDVLAHTDNGTVAGRGVVTVALAELPEHGAAMLVLSPTGENDDCPRTKTPAKSDDSALPTRKLLGGGEIPMLIMGGSNFSAWWELAGKPAAIQTFLGYGNGPKIAPQLAAVGRENVFVSTGIYCGGIDNPNPPMNTSAAMALVEKELAELETPYADLLLMHHRCQTEADTTQVWAAFEQAKAAGKARHLGVSNFNAHDLAALNAVATSPVEANEARFGVGAMDYETLAYMNAHGIVPISYSSLAEGSDHPTVTKVAAAHSVTVEQVRERCISGSTGLLQV